MLSLLTKSVEQAACFEREGCMVGGGKSVGHLAEGQRYAGKRKLVSGNMVN